MQKIRTHTFKGNINMRKQAYTLILAILSLTSCNDKNIGPLYNEEAGFGFASSVLNIEAAPEDGNVILVPIHRGSLEINIAEIGFDYNVSESLSAEPEWSPSDPSSVFSLTTERVIFPEGSHTAYAQIRYTSLEDMSPTGKYSMKLTIKNQISPSRQNQIIITAGRKLTFESLGKCIWHDACIFLNTYEAELFKAKEAGVYRVTDPYSEGFIAEDYVADGLVQNPPEYVEFYCDEEGNITYEPFKTGMLVPVGNEGKFMAYGYYPSDYLISWGADFSKFDKENKKLSDKVFQLYPVYCLPDFRYGYLNDGAYPLTITLK